MAVLAGLRRCWRSGLIVGRRDGRCTAAATGGAAAAAIEASKNRDSLPETVAGWRRRNSGESARYLLLVGVLGVADSIRCWRLAALRYLSPSVAFGLRRNCCVDRPPDSGGQQGWQRLSGGGWVNSTPFTNCRMPRISAAMGRQHRAMAATTLCSLF